MNLIQNMNNFESPAHLTIQLTKYLNSAQNGFIFATKNSIEENMFLALFSNKDWSIGFVIE